MAVCRQPHLRRGTLPGGDRGLAVARRGRRVSERARSAEAKQLMDVDALTLPHMAHGEADCTVKVLNVREGPSLQAKIIGSLTAGQRVTVWAAKVAWWLVAMPTGRFDGLGFTASISSRSKNWCGPLRLRSH